MARIFLDEMYSGLKPFLKALGWDVLTVEEVGLKGAEDEKILAHAERNGLLLVTQEHRVADLARLLGIPHVLIGPVEIAKIIDAKLREFERSQAQATKK